MRRYSSFGCACADAEPEPETDLVFVPRECFSWLLKRVFCANKKLSSFYTSLLRACLSVSPGDIVSVYVSSANAVDSMRWIMYLPCSINFSMEK